MADHTIATSKDVSWPTGTARMHRYCSPSDRLPQNMSYPTTRCVCNFSQDACLGLMLANLQIEQDRLGKNPQHNMPTLLALLWLTPIGRLPARTMQDAARWPSPSRSTQRRAAKCFGCRHRHGNMGRRVWYLKSICSQVVLQSSDGVSAQQHPECQVLGTDITPIQPQW